MKTTWHVRNLRDIQRSNCSEVLTACELFSTQMLHAPCALAVLKDNGNTRNKT